MGDVIAMVIVLLLMLWSVYVLLRRFMPKTTMRVQHALADQVTRHGWQRLGQWITPKASRSSCGSCSSCGGQSTNSRPSTDKTVEEKVQPVRWR